MIDPADLVREHVDAFNSRDLDRLLAGFADDALWVTGTTAVRGRAELSELFSGAMEGLLPTLTIRSLLAAEDRVACELTETLVASGEERTYAIAAFYELRDGRITAAKVYREGSADVE